MWFLIPSYEPGSSLAALVRGLMRHGGVLVVDDGSGPAFASQFAHAREAGAIVIGHDVNRGKAAALRTGFTWLLAHGGGEVVVCVDSDGQHLVKDAVAVGATAERRAAAHARPAVMLGTRALDGKVPLRSRVGNRATTALVAAMTGVRIADTQTGLRAYPASLLAWAIGVGGERFAYELRLLLAATRAGIPMQEVPISTVYIEHNASSHFRPIADSARVLAPLWMFALSSVVAAGIDLAATLILYATTGSLALAVTAARVMSASLNFAVNRSAVFGSRGALGAQALRYGALAVALLGASYVATATLHGWGVPLAVATVATDSLLWCVSFGVQRLAVFGPRRQERRTFSIERPLANSSTSLSR